MTGDATTERPNLGARQLGKPSNDVRLRNEDKEEVTVLVSDPPHFQRSSLGQSFAAVNSPMLAVSAMPSRSMESR